MIRSRGEILPRFERLYGRLRRLPRQVRRALQRRFATSLAGLALALALGVSPTLAATIAVGGRCTLADAIAAANTDSPVGGCTAGSGDDTLSLASGSTHTFAAAQDTGYGPTALPTIRSAITIEGNGSTLRRDPTAAPFRLLAVAREASLTLQDTAITGGSLPGGDGGALYAYGGGLVVSGCTFTANAALYGGAILTYGSNVAVSTTTFSGNASEEGGGAIFADGSSVWLQDSALTGNTAADGGAIGSKDGAFSVYGSVLSGNAARSADSGYGGAIAALRGSLALRDSAVADNTALGGGGGIAIDTARAFIDHSTLAGNTAVTVGGGIASDGGDLTVWESTLAANAAARGGGISSDGDGAVLIARETTIALNSAHEKGGGIESSGPLVLGRSLVSGNTAPLSGAEVESTGAASAVYANESNLFGHDGEAGIAGFAPGPNDLVPTAPLAGITASSLADNGGPTLTLALVPGSPAIDRIPAGEMCFSDDQRGVARPQGAACDIGAFEATAGNAEICGNCIDDDGDGAIDLADPDCASNGLATEKGALLLKPTPNGDQVALTATLANGASINPRLEGATVSFADASGQIACVRIPAQAAAAPKAWSEKRTKVGTTWRFKDAKDGSLGDPTNDAFNAQCRADKGVCTVKLKVKRANLAGSGDPRTITTGIVIGDDAWKKDQPWAAKAKGTRLTTP